MAIKILMPALSPTMEEGTLAKWLVAEGAEVRSGDVIAEIETDKATMEVEALDDGTIGKILLGYFQVLYAFRQLPSIRWPAAFAMYIDALAFFSFSPSRWGVVSGSLGQLCCLCAMVATCKLFFPPPASCSLFSS